jgi:phosphatidylglycerol---prolipoprotein diacylglyceryl transferase
MYPVLGRIGDFEITSFGLLVALGVLVGLWIFRRELRAAGLPPDIENAALVGALGGFIGAKVFWTLENIGDAPLSELVFSRSGLSWFGGLFGGLAAGIGTIVVKRLPLVSSLAAASPALAVGHLFGRIGCFLVGDDYGEPSSLPWAVAFPEGRPPIDVLVHPTQLYEAIFLGWLAWWLIRERRRRVSDPHVLGHYMILAGGFRFVLEFIRVNDPVLIGFTVAQMLALLLTATGVVLVTRASSPRGRQSRRSLS